LLLSIENIFGGHDMIMADTAIIASAGRGSRLGHSIPKACTEVGGKTLIQWQLEALKDIRHIVVVVGYRRNYVIDELLTHCNRVTLVVNENWENTNTAYSLSMACDLFDADKRVLTIDGDTIFTKEDVNNMLKHELAIGVTEPNSELGVFVELDTFNCVTAFTRKRNTGYEWSGMALLQAGFFHSHPNCFVYEVIENYLPIHAQKINLIEIDTPDDLFNAREWIMKYNMPISVS
jgi:choline kinase